MAEAEKPVEQPGTDFTEAAGVVYPATIANGPEIVYPEANPTPTSTTPPATPAPAPPADATH